MHIIHIIEIRGIGGAENLLKEFLPAQHSANHHISCLILYQQRYKDVAFCFSEQLTDNNISVYHISYTNKISLVFCLGRIRKLIKQQRPDIIHSHLRIADFVTAILKITGINIPVVATIHGYSKITFERERRLLLQSIYKRFDGLIFISAFVNRLATEQGLIGKKAITSIVFNGYTASSINAIPVHRNFSLHSVSIILPGRLVDAKGHQFAIEAVKYLVADFPDIKLDFYGTGPMEPHIKKMISDASVEKNVFLKGFTDQLKTLIPQYDVVLIPSVIEAFGMVFLDAFNAAVPVVAFDLPAGNEIVTDGYDGLLAIPYSAKSLAEKIREIIADEQLRIKLTGNALVSLKEKFSMQQMVAGYDATYRRLLNSHPY